MTSVPNTLGYRMPAEWSWHRGTWLSWPHKEASWPGKFAPVPAIFAEVVQHLAPREEVHINVAGPDEEAAVRDLVARQRSEPALASSDAIAGVLNLPWGMDVSPAFFTTWGFPLRWEGFCSSSAASPA